MYIWHNFFFTVHMIIIIILNVSWYYFLCWCLEYQGRYCLSSHNKDPRQTALFEICLLYIIRQIFVAFTKCILHLNGQHLLQTSMGWSKVPEINNGMPLAFFPEIFNNLWWSRKRLSVSVWRAPVNGKTHLVFFYFL